MSSALQYTTAAALQNATAVASTHVDRSAVILVVVFAMHAYHAQNDILLKGADLIAYHLNQSTHSMEREFHVATRGIVDTVDKLSIISRDASKAILALVLTALHIASTNASSPGCPSSAKRFSKSSVTSAIIDHQFDFAIVLVLFRDRSNPRVQLLGCKLIRVATTGATSFARLAAEKHLQVKNM